MRCTFPFLEVESRRGGGSFAACHNGVKTKQPSGKQSGGGGGAIAVRARPAVAAGRGVRVGGGPAAVRGGARGRHHAGVLQPHLRLPDAVGAGVLRPRHALRRPQRAPHRPGAAVEGAMAVVRRVHARLLRAPRHGQGGGDHLRQGRLPRPLLRRRRPPLPRRPGHTRRPPPPPPPLRLLPGLPSRRLLPPEASRPDWYGPFLAGWWLPAGQDMALILDVARFKYPPHWVPLPLLWEAMNTIDEATGLLRGFMLISRNTEAPLLICAVNCRDESWQSMAKYCIEDVPNLLKDNNVDNVLTILSRLVNHLPPNAGNFIKWVIEVKRQEERGSSSSEEANGMAFLKEKVLQQIRDTKLFQLVHKLQCSKQLCCSCSSSRDEDSLAQISASVCCEGTALLNGNLSSRDGFCFRETCSECAQVNDEGLKAVITGKVVSEGNLHVDKLSPISSSQKCFCNSNLNNETVKYPSNTDILTVLLLSLHPSTWLGIEDEKLKAEFQSLVSTDDLPDALKLEILHLRRQLRYLKACREKEAYEDIEPQDL